MLGDRRRINRLLKPDRRRSPERRRNSTGAKGAPGGKERRERLRRFADRIRSE